MTSISDVRPVGYSRSLIACLVWAGGNLLVIVALLGPPPSLGAAARAVVSLLVTAALAALMVWLVARTRRTAWPPWQLLALALPAFGVLRLVLSGV